MPSLPRPQEVILHHIDRPLGDNLNGLRADIYNLMIILSLPDLWMSNLIATH
jgi:hypothetical protein